MNFEGIANDIHFALIRARVWLANKLTPGGLIGPNIESIKMHYYMKNFDWDRARTMALLQFRAVDRVEPVGHLDFVAPAFPRLEMLREQLGQKQREIDEIERKK